MIGEKEGLKELKMKFVRKRKLGMKGILRKESDTKCMKMKFVLIKENKR